MTNYMQWQKSWDKWNGDLWGRLEKKWEEIQEIAPFDYTREDAFFSLLWGPCSYCKKFQSCSHCPLYEQRACSSTLSRRGGPYTYTNWMYIAWVRGDRNMFGKYQQRFLKALKETKFPDKEEEK